MFSPLSVSSAWHSLKKRRTTESCGGKAHNDKTTADSKSQKNNLGRGGAGKQNVFNWCKFNQGIKPQNTWFLQARGGETHAHTATKAFTVPAEIFTVITLCSSTCTVFCSQHHQCMQEKWFYYGWRDECLFLLLFSLLKVTLNTFFKKNRK